MNPFAHRGHRGRRAAAWLLVPTILLFGLGSALEVFHPVEESVRDVGEHHLFDESRAAIHAHDTPAFDHDHDFCAHSNAVAFVARLRTAFQAADAFVAITAEPADRPTPALLAVLDRGPPSF